MQNQEPPINLLASEALMRGGSKSFFAASRVLPRRVRGPATALYAYCRLADDAVDGQGDAAIADEQVMAVLQARLERVYRSDPSLPEVERALSEVVKRFAIPQALLSALLEGFEWDRQGRTYETLEEVQAYAARVAGTVGAMMSLIMGTRSEAALARACELGVAMQLTNIARDVGEDARNGRLYLPRAWMREAGIDPEVWLKNPQFTLAIASVVARVLATADELYERAVLGIAELPRDCRPAIQAARLVYAEIGREVERAGLDSLSRRAVVSQERKLALMLRSLSAAIQMPSSKAAENAASLRPLPAIEFLVQAARRSTDENTLRHGDSFYDRTVWVISLFERMAERKLSAHELPTEMISPQS
jgi:15-cis-phytoene synthase